MKIRIQKDFARFRLNQAEVETFSKTGTIESAINFESNPLVYRLAATDKTNKVKATFEQNCITVQVPLSTAKDWTQTDRVGFENEDQTDIRILVEKDFKCLHREDQPDQEDSYPHPKAGS